MSRTREPAGLEIAGSRRAPSHEGGSIWVFKGHAKFYFRIRAATVRFAFLEVCRGEVRGEREREIAVTSGKFKND